MASDLPQGIFSLQPSGKVTKNSSLRWIIRDGKKVLQEWLIVEYWDAGRVRAESEWTDVQLAIPPEKL